MSQAGLSQSLAFQTSPIQCSKAVTFPILISPPLNQSTIVVCWSRKPKTHSILADLSIWRLTKVVPILNTAVSNSCRTKLIWMQLNDSNNLDWKTLSNGHRRWKGLRIYLRVRILKEFDNCLRPLILMREILRMSVWFTHWLHAFSLNFQAHGTLWLKTQLQRWRQSPAKCTMES